MAIFSKLSRSLRASVHALRKGLAEPEAYEPQDLVPHAKVLGDFVETFSVARARNDQETVSGLAADYHRFVLAMEEAASPATRGREGPLAFGTGTQSRQFMIDLLPRVQAFLDSEPREQIFSVLDVGSGTGHGAELLASLYASYELGYRLRVTSLDINEDYKNYIAVACRYLRFKRSDLFELNDKYDIVVASHVVEHVKDPLAFCRQLQKTARKVAFVAAPFEEPADKLTSGHLHSLDQAFLDSLDATSIDIIESPGWGAFIDPPYKVFIAQLPPR